MARTNDDVLAELLDRLPAAPPALDRHQRNAQPLDQDKPRQRQRQRANTQPGLYELILGKGALVIALALFAGIWYAGAYFTLQAFTGWKVSVASWGLAAWLIPIAITALESGLMVIRARSIWAWLSWIFVLGIDVFTTASGLADITTGRIVAGYTLSIADPSTWIVVGIAGLLIAVIPEPAIRSIGREILQ
jgi:hypothetical protein